MARVDALSQKALRVLAIAARPLTRAPDADLDAEGKFKAVLGETGEEDGGGQLKKPTMGRSKEEEGGERGEMVLLGLVASIDPEREGVPEAVLAAQEANIRVIMITGDYLVTAKAIARNVNILPALGDQETQEEELKGHEKEGCQKEVITALDCSLLRPNGEYLPKEEIDALTRTVKVFGRAKPEDKLEIVLSLQRQNLVSAMTGDGVNDAPALNRADIGIAMGLAGTEVAKGASDLILTDDNFCSIMSAVEMGRGIYAGIQKFVAFVLSVHLAEVIQILVCVCASLPIMRTPLQILFQILVTDLPPTIALAMEPAHAGILRDRPRPKKEPIVKAWMWLGILINAIILSITVMAVYVFSLHYYVGVFSIDEILSAIAAESANFASPSPSEFVGASTYTLDQLVKARTTAFVALVWSENVRAYTSRSFFRPVWEGFFRNRIMALAIAFAQAALYVGVFVPFLSDSILDLNGLAIGWEGWLTAFIGACATLVLCELYKVFSSYYVQGRVVQQQQQQ